MCTGDVMTLFKHTSIDIGSICDADCKFVFHKTSRCGILPKTTAHHHRVTRTYWSKAMAICLTIGTYKHKYATYYHHKRIPQEFNAFDLPSVDSLMRYFHESARFPVQDTWICAIKCGDYSSWPGLTYSNAAKRIPSSDKTIMVHLVQSRQSVCSTKPKVDES